MGRDEISFFFQDVASKSNTVQNGKGDNSTILEKQKAIFKKVICDIVGNANAATQIFKEDKSSILHSDIYTFLVTSTPKL